jgi:hypothetical protein
MDVRIRLQQPRAQYIWAGAATTTTTTTTIMITSTGTRISTGTNINISNKITTSQIAQSGRAGIYIQSHNAI